MNESTIFAACLGVYLAKYPENPERAAVEAKVATKAAMAEWLKEEKKKTPQKPE